MFPSSQPSRPKIQPGPQKSPLFQQQTSTVYAQQSSQVSAKQTPGSQVEAMPPHRVPESQQSSAGLMYNPAVIHPVFFTDAWRKPPFPIPINGSFNPVATGYVFGNTRPRLDSMTKL